MFQPTKEQKRAIESDNAKILVSASAGTGKTTVMINRIVRLLKEGKAKPEDLLVITFTNAAAAEMEERLSAELSSHPEMHRVLSGLSAATIGTIHSFCAQLVRTFFYFAGVDPNFAVMDEWQNSAMKKRVMNRVFSEYYQIGDPVFQELIGITGKRSDDRLSEIVEDMLSFRECIPDFNEYLRRNENYRSVFDFHIKKLGENAEASIRFYSEKAEKLFACAENEKLKSALAEFLRILNCGYSFDVFGLRDYFAENEFPSVRSGRNDSAADKEAFQAYSSIKKALKSDLDRVFSAIKGQTRRGAAIRFLRSRTYGDKLVEIFLKFDEQYEKEKVGSGLLDFASLESHAMRILGNDEVLTAVRERYSYVFVDEYQDVNDVQERIISLVSEKADSFMVGDVKQCIYGFRMSEPENFRKRRKLFESEGGDVIDLNGNFRSDGRILNFVNRVFSPIMTEDFGGCDYSVEAMLSGTVSVKESEASGVRIINYEKKPKEKIGFTERIERGEIYEIEKDLPDRDTEGTIIARKIKSLVGTEIEADGVKKAITFSDIAVLARKKETLSSVYNCLISDGIPSRLSSSGDFLRGDDVKQIVSLLRIISNRTDDLSMYNVMTGFFGGFTLGEVCAIAASDKSGSLFDKVKKNYSEPKCEKFIKLFNYYKLASVVCSADMLVNIAVNESGFRRYVYSLERGSERISALDSFMEIIDGLPECRTVSGMLRFLEDCELSGNVTGVNDADAVKLMTIHSSKGLEFPIVFLAGTDGRFRLESKLVICDKNGGITMKCYDPQRRKILDCATYSSNYSIRRRRDAEEELRLLYVALTRAKYGLFVTKEAVVSEDKRPDTVISSAAWLNSLFMKDAENGLDEKRRGYSSEFVGYEKEKSHFPLPSERYEERKARLVFAAAEDVKEEIEKIEIIDLSDGKKVFVPRKVVSSKLKSEFEDSEFRRDYFVDEDGESIPAFLSGPFGNMDADIERLKKQKKNTALGTAYHKLIECVRLAPTDSETVECFAKELLKDGFIEEEIYDDIEPEIVVKTTRDEKLRRLIDGCVLLFEQRFVSNLAVNELVEGVDSDEETMLQGAIDLLAVNKEEKRAIIVDYKYTGSLRGIKERYYIQLNSYKLAVAKLLPDYDIKAFVYALGQNELIRLC